MYTFYTNTSSPNTSRYIYMMKLYICMYSFSENKTQWLYAPQKFNFKRSVYVYTHMHISSDLFGG